MKVHNLSLADRGLEHVHRWWPRCRCGWTGCFRRRRGDAEKEYREHVAQQRVARRDPFARSGPASLTPVAMLPEALR